MRACAVSRLWNVRENGHVRSVLDTCELGEKMPDKFLFIILFEYAKDRLRTVRCGERLGRQKLKSPNRASLGANNKYRWNGDGTSRSRRHDAMRPERKHLCIGQRARVARQDRLLRTGGAFLWRRSSTQPRSFLERRRDAPNRLSTSEEVARAGLRAIQSARSSLPAPWACSAVGARRR